MSLHVVVCGIIAIVAWFYYTKFEQAQENYYSLYKKHVDLQNEHELLKARNEELQVYKNDVSRTFRLLDDEITMIHRHIEHTQPHQEVQLEKDQRSTHIQEEPFQQGEIEIALKAPSDATMYEQFKIET